jgi:hypothetical protein
VFEYAKYVVLPHNVFVFFIIIDYKEPVNNFNNHASQY